MFSEHLLDYSVSLWDVFTASQCMCWFQPFCFKFLLHLHGIQLDTVQLAIRVISEDVGARRC